MRIVLVPILALLVALTGCSGDDDGATDDGRTDVVAAFFPLAEAARRSGADVDVVDLTPPGVEPHEIELSSEQVDQVLDADVVIVLGGDFQPAVEEVAAGRDGRTIDLFETLDLDSGDPHVWLDPTIMARIAEAIADELGGDATEFVRELEALDATFTTELSSCERDVLVASHEAYGYLADRYGLRMETINGLVPEEEPDPAKLDELADLVEREGVTTIFNEPLLPRRAAETLARETGAEVAVLDPLESDPGVGYVEAMEANLAALTKGLGCTGA